MIKMSISFGFALENAIIRSSSTMRSEYLNASYVATCRYGSAVVTSSLNRAPAAMVLGICCGCACAVADMRDLSFPLLNPTVLKSNIKRDPFSNNVM